MIKSLLNLTMLTPFLLNCLIIMIMMIPKQKSKIHPMLYMLLLMMMTFILTIKMNLTLQSWTPFILFLSMIGGLMIIFIYIVSLANNELFKLNLKLIFLKIMKILIFTILLFLIYKNFTNLFYQNLNIFSSMSYYEQMNMNLFYKKFYNFSTFFMMMYLFLSMIIIMKICSTHKTPLRQINN